jgi:hypothetical protein
MVRIRFPPAASQRRTPFGTVSIHGAELPRRAVNPPEGHEGVTKIVRAAQAAIGHIPKRSPQPLQ